MTDTDPVRSHKILFHVRCKGDPGGMIQPKVFYANMGTERQRESKYTDLML